MKILYFGSLDPHSMSRFYLKALQELGHECFPMDPEYFKARNIVEKVRIKLRRAPLESRVKHVAHKLIQLCRREKFDLIFVLSENFLGAETMREIKRIRPEIKFSFHSHDNLFFDGILKGADFFESLKLYDFVFTNKSHNVNRYKQVGAERTYYIASSYEPTIHHPVNDDNSLYGPNRFDVTFIGTYDGSRDKYVEAVGWDRLHVWGNGWRRFPGYLANRREITGRAIYGIEFADVVSHSRINLGLLREEAEDLHTIRTFEIPACGGLQLAPRNEEILSFFDEDKEIVCFSSPEEMHHKIEYYLKHETTRQKIAEKGYEKVLRTHNTYRDRVDEMLRLIRQESSQRERISATLAR